VYRFVTHHRATRRIAAYCRRDVLKERLLGQCLTEHHMANREFMARNGSDDKQPAAVAVRLRPEYRYSRSKSATRSQTPLR